MNVVVTQDMDVELLDVKIANTKQDRAKLLAIVAGFLQSGPGEIILVQPGTVACFHWPAT